MLPRLQVAAILVPAAYQLKKLLREKKSQEIANLPYAEEYD